MVAPRLAVIAGSGVSIDDLAPEGDDREVRLDETPVTVRESGAVVVLGRHGPERSTPAHRIDHGANMAAIEHLGCERVLAVASSGSLRRDWPVGTVVLPDDFFAPWVAPSRYDDTRGHTVPGFDMRWRARVRDTWRDVATTPIIDGGVYVQTSGPRFETPAEIRFLSTVGDLVGMTVASECVLAKEFGLAYATVCMIDNMANGLDDVALSLDEFQRGVASNRDQLVADVRRLVRQLAPEG